MSPTLERHQSEYVDCMLDQINQMTENLKRCKKHDFRVAIHKMEVRWSYFILIDMRNKFVIFSGTSRSRNDFVLGLFLLLSFLLLWFSTFSQKLHNNFFLYCGSSF